jgi:GST-like protein
MNTAATVTLYGGNSPNVRKVGILLEELGLDYELRHVGVFTGEQFNPQFLKLNPFGKVPVLVDAALALPLYESGAILFYLAEQHQRFLPIAGAARYDVMKWLMVQMAMVGPMFGQLNHFRLVLRRGSEPYAEGRYAEQAGRIYGELDRQLARRPWIAGDDYSIADMAIYPWALYLENHGFAADQHPALLAWRDRIGTRPAIARSNQRFQEAFAKPSEASRRAATDADLDRFFGRTESVPPADYSNIRRL